MRRNPAWLVDPYPVPPTTQRVGRGDVRDKLFRIGGLLASYHGDGAVDIPFAFISTGPHLFLPDPARVEEDIHRDWDQEWLLERGIQVLGRGSFVHSSELDGIEWSNKTRIIGTLSVRPPGVVVRIRMTSTEPGETRRVDREIEERIEDLVRFFRNEMAIVADCELTWVYFGEPTIDQLIRDGYLDHDEMREYEENYGDEWFKYYSENLLESYPDAGGELTEDAGLAKDYST